MKQASNDALKKREKSRGKKQRGIREMVKPLPLRLSFPPLFPHKKKLNVEEINGNVLRIDLNLQIKTPTTMEPSDNDQHNNK